MKYFLWSFVFLDKLGRVSVVVDLLFIVAPIVCGGSLFDHCFIIQCIVSACFCKHLDGKERASCFGSTVCLMSCGSQRSVPLPRGTLRWYAVCDFGVPGSYSLVFVGIYKQEVH